MYFYKTILIKKQKLLEGENITNYKKIGRCYRIGIVMLMDDKISQSFSYINCYIEIRLLLYTSLTQTNR